ncbi:MAG: SAF domain-containing protein [Haloferacaceae archaeon]
MNLATKLRALDEPVRVGFVGAGIFGSQVIHAVEATAGMETAVIADVETGKAATTFRRTGVDEDDVRTAGTAADVDEIVDAGARAVTDDGRAAVDADVDVVVDATGNADVAARHGYLALTAGKHFVNVSVEADTVCGRLLAEVAERNGVTYTLAYGDQPGRIVDLCEWAGAAGFEVVAAGKASRLPQHYGTPDDAIERYGDITSFGEGLDPDPVIYNTFLDGTKEAVESVAAANACGLGVDATGLHRPEVAVDELPEAFQPTDRGGVLDSTGVVDAVAPPERDFSVFVVTRTDSEQLREYFAVRPKVTTSANGEYQVFTQPYHFAPETTVSIASAALLNEPTGAPKAHLAEVVGAAKTDLEPGDEIDGGGGYTAYGLAADADRAAEAGYVPFELLDGAEVVRPIARDERITYDDVALDTDQFLYHLRAMQEAT